MEKLLLAVDKIADVWGDLPDLLQRGNRSLGDSSFAVLKKMRVKRPVTLLPSHLTVMVGQCASHTAVGLFGYGTRLREISLLV
jgi:hypothetical protein